MRVSLIKGRLRDQHPSSKQLIEKHGSEARSYGAKATVLLKQGNNPEGAGFSEGEKVPPHGPLSQVGGRVGRGQGEAGFCPRTLSILPGPKRVCPPRSGWGLGPEWEPRSWAKENPGRELEVRTGGQQVGGGLHLTGLPSPPPPWHHKARSRISPVPALTSRQRRRILSHAIWRARRSPEHCGGRGRGQRGRCPPQSGEEAAGPPPPKPFWT